MGMDKQQATIRHGRILRAGPGVGEDAPVPDDFPRRYALTGRFTHGSPRSFTITAGGDGLLFLRSTGPEDPANCLWLLRRDGTETLLADPRALAAEATRPGDPEGATADSEEVPAEEAARRERSREAGAGITSYSVDETGRRVAFALSGRLFTVDADTGKVSQVPTAAAVVDPRISPDGRYVAYCGAGALRVVDAAGADRALLEPDGARSWGLADFAAAEEFDRHRGFWWAPSSDRLLVAGVDESPVLSTWIADPAHPDLAPREHRYPRAGTDNAIVTLVVAPLAGPPLPVEWDREAFEYLTSVHYSEHGDPLVQVLNRRQDHAQVLRVDPNTAATELLAEQRDDAWVDVIAGTPGWDATGRLLTVEPVADTYRLLADGTPIGPSEWHVRAVSVDDAGIRIAGGPDAGQRQVVSLTSDLVHELTPTEGLHAVVRRGGTTVTSSATLQSTGTSTRIDWNDGTSTVLTDMTDSPELLPQVHLQTCAGMRCAVVRPSWWHESDGRLPVLLSPYGGPHASRAVGGLSAYLVDQWFAEAGFAVVIVDGRGTPGSPKWEREVRFDLASAPLADQLLALDALAEQHPELDTARVGIRGWSFGGFLAALAVLREPDRVHAAVAGAPPTDWSWYDTAYTERYLGLPQEHPEAYEVSGLIDDASALENPLLLIHGLADDNVLAAHTLRLSTALLAAGRAHTVLPLTGVTHMTPQVDVAENLLVLQRDWLIEALGLEPVADLD
jgi:dipeptidyl-peptidase-4